MSVFEDFRFEWNGREHIIPAGRMMGAIGAVEEHLTLHEIHAMMQERKTVRMERIACAYGALLRYSGVEVTDDEVYASFFADGAARDKLIASLIGLQQLMLPPSSYAADEPGKSRGERNSAGASSSPGRSKLPAGKKNSAAGD